jgi:hypothetical protein
MEAGFSISLTIADHLFEARDFRFRKHFLTESERSGERLLQAARRVSGSDSIYRINKISRTGVKWQSRLILNVGLWI